MKAFIIIYIDMHYIGSVCKYCKYWAIQHSLPLSIHTL